MKITLETEKTSSGDRKQALKGNVSTNQVRIYFKTIPKVTESKGKEGGKAKYSFIRYTKAFINQMNFPNVEPKVTDNSIT